MCTGDKPGNRGAQSTAPSKPREQLMCVCNCGSARRLGQAHRHKPKAKRPHRLNIGPIGYRLTRDRVFSSRGRVRPTRVSRARPRRAPADDTPGGGPDRGHASCGPPARVACPRRRSGRRVELCPPDPAAVAAPVAERDDGDEPPDKLMTNVQEHSHRPQSWRTRAQTTVTVRATALRYYYCSRYRPHSHATPCRNPNPFTHHTRRNTHM
jgi:hypothetical protein